MCGIVGFTGHRQAAPVLLDGLAKLEYRGYDSAGIAVRDGEKEVEIVKAKGRLRVLAEKTNDGTAMHGTCGIGHTRWATHGEPSELNAHPHCSDDRNVVGVHNGIIENYQELREKLQHKGYNFYSDTDTEVAIKLIDYYYKKYEHTPVDAINHAMVRIRGSYALAIMFRDYPEEIYAARKDSPMIIGVADGESFVASDVPAILKYTRNVYYIGNMEMCRLQKGSVTFYNLDGDEIEKDLVEIQWDAEAAEKAGFEHFMMKEIHEQPKAVRDTVNSVAADLYCCLWFRISCWCCGPVCDRGAGTDPGPRRAGVGVPLPENAVCTEFSCDHRKPVRGDGGQPCGAPGGEGPWG